MFEPRQSYRFRIPTHTEYYPDPFAELTGRWSVQPQDTGLGFDIEIIATLKVNAVSIWLSAAMAKPQFRAILIDPADARAARMEAEARIM